MADINTITLVGRLTKDVELSTTNSGTSLAKFSIASNEFAGAGKDDTVSFFNILVWGKMAEICNQYIGKGKQVVINGRIKQDRYEDKEGKKVSSISIVAQNVQFVGGKSESNGNSSAPSSNNSAPIGDDVPF